MATRPNVKHLTATSVDILNVIRSYASVNYQTLVPKAILNDGESVKAIGNVLMAHPELQNEFLNALVNRIGRVLVTNKMYENPWAFFKKGLLEFGESIEEIFVNIAKPFQFDPEVAESEVFKREIPDVRSAFHVMNYQKFYKVTIQQEQLRQAFLSIEGVTDLIAKIVDAMYTGANYDEFLVMKYMLAKHIINGLMYPVTIPTVSAGNMKEITGIIKGVSNNYEFLSNKYNLAGVYNSSKKDDQYLLINSQFDATMDVEVLASAFNMDKAQFMGHRVLVDSFGSLDNARLAVLFEDDPTYVALTDAQLQALDAIPAVLVDREWFMIFDNLYNFTENYNGQGLYWNYFYHVWKTFSVSPFANNALFVPGTPAVTGVTVSPATGTVMKGATIQLSAVVATEYFASQAVNWSVEGDATITPAGLLTIDADATTGGTVTVTATSVFNGSVTGTATITVA